MDKLKGKIPEALNNTVLKDIDFRETNKEQVRRAIVNEQSKKMNLKKMSNKLLPIAATAFLFLGGGFYILTDSQQPSTSATDSSQQLLQEDILEDEILTKEDIVHKMLNTVDYFDTAIGRFEEYTLFYDDSESKAVIEYEVSLEDEIGGYEKIVTEMDESLMGYAQDVQSIYYNDKKTWLLNDRRKMYFEGDYEVMPKRNVTTLEAAFAVDIDYLYENKTFRERPPIGAAGMSLFPYEKAASYLRNMQLWEIEQQSEQLLGHHVIVLAGKLDPKVVSETNLTAATDTFRFWVDKNTGILVKYETYNEDGILTSYLYPKSLKVNVPIDSERFAPELDGYVRR